MILNEFGEKQLLAELAAASGKNSLKIEAQACNQRSGSGQFRVEIKGVEPVIGIEQIHQP